MDLISHKFTNHQFTIFGVDGRRIKESEIVSKREGERDLNMNSSSLYLMQFFFQKSEETLQFSQLVGSSSFIYF